MADQTQEQMQQPLVVYPNTYTQQYPIPSSSSSSPPPSSSGSGGSFGAVFIVLAVILVLSALACVFGRLCNRTRLPNLNSKPPKHQKSSKKSREIRPVEREPKQRGDLEFGFDLKPPPMMGKPPSRDGGDFEFGFDHKKRGGGGGGGGRGEGGGGGGAPPAFKHGVRFMMAENGDLRGADIEFRPTGRH